MLRQVDVTTRRGTTLSLEMEENDSGYQVSIEGLNPVNATLVSASVAGLHGEQYQSFKREPRNIKFKMDLQPDFVNNTFTSLRQNLYSYFLPGSQIKLRFFMTTGLYLDINGVVEEHSSPMFEQDPEVDISVMCFSPDLIDPRIVKIPGGSVSDNTITSIDYPGTIETGVVLTMNVNRALPSFTVYTIGEDGVLLQMDFTEALQADDQLVVSSLSGAKGITLTRDGISSSLLRGKPPQSAWIQLSEGINQFRVYAPGDPVPYEMEYLVRYGGI